MVETNKPKRRNNVNKNLDSHDLLKRKKAAEKRGIPELYNLSVAINQRLIDLGKNQEWLVDETQIGKATISAYCNAESLPNGINLLKLADKLQTTPDYLLGFTNTPTTDITIKAIHEKTGLSDHAIKNLINFKNYNCDWTGMEVTVLNLLLQRSDFYELIADINWMRIDRINKVIYENNEDNQSVGIYGSRVYGSAVVLDPSAFYQFNISELKEYFIELIESIIDDSIRDKSVEDLTIAKELLIKKWESVVKEESDLNSDEQRDELINHLRTKYNYQQ